MKRLLPYACFLVAAVLVIFIEPPMTLVDLIGSDVWARLALGVVVTLVLFMFLIVLGLAAGKVGLPLGLSLEGGADPHAAPGIVALEALAVEMAALREADERIFERIGAVGALLERASERITLLEAGAALPPEINDDADGSETN